jgi:hypothetical protein
MRLRRHFHFILYLALVTISAGCIPMGGERVEPWSTLAQWGPLQPDVTGENGDGSSYETAFVVHTTLGEVSTTEDRWILWNYKPQFDGSRLIQRRGTLARSKGWFKRKNYDIITLTRSDGTKRIFYFDVSHLRMESPRARGE